MFQDIMIAEILSVTENDNYALQDRRFPRHYLNRKISGAAMYRFPDAEGGKGLSFRAGEGDIVFIPAGTRYTVELLEAGRYLSVGFTTEGEAPLEPMLIRNASQVETLQILEKMKTNWIFQAAGAELELKGLLYQLLAVCVRTQRTAYHSSHQLDRLKAALSYLEEHIFDPELSVGSLNERAGISEVYFRKLFQSVYHTSPTKYIINSRITYARGVLEENPQIKVSELAEKVGYPDPFYFSRVFRSLTGISPQKYQAMCQRLKVEDGKQP